MSAAQNLIRRGQQVARRETRVLRLQGQISRLRSQRSRLFGEMGQKVFELFQRDLVKNQDLRMMCQQIRGIDAEVDLKREEIEQLRRAEAPGESGVEADPAQEAGILDDEV